MKALEAVDRDVLTWLRPDTLFGALIYLVLFVLLAAAFTRVLRRALHASLLV